MFFPLTFPSPVPENKQEPPTTYNLLKSNSARLVHPGLLNLTSLEEFLLGTLPPTVAWSFLLTGSSPPNVDGPASAAIWANCQVGDNKGDLPTPSSCSASAILCMMSSAHGGTSLAGVGGALGMRVFSISPPPVNHPDP